MFVILTEKAKKNFEQTLRSACIKGQVFPTDETFEDFIKDSMACYDAIGRANPVKAVKLPDTFFQLNKVLLKINPKDQQAATHELASQPELLFENNGVSVPQAVPHSTPDRRKKPPITIDHVRAAVIHHMTHNDGKVPNFRSGLLEEGTPLHDGKRTWIAIDRAIKRGGLGLQNTGYTSLSNFCKTDKTIQPHLKPKISFDTRHAAVIHHMTTHNGQTPKIHSGLLEEGSPLHDGKRRWASLDTAIRAEGSGLKNTGYTSLPNFCKTDEGVKAAVTTLKATSHTPITSQKKSSTKIGSARAGAIVKGNPTNHTNGSLNHHFNYNSLIETMVAHTNSTRSQPDPRDTSPIEHGPLANGVLAWSNVAFALACSDKRLENEKDKVPPDLKILFETTILPRSDVVRHFALPLPPEMRMGQKDTPPAPQQPL